MKLLIRVVAFSLLFASTSVFSAKALIVSDTWEGYTDEDFSGYYFEVVREALSGTDWELEFRIAPYSRSITIVEEGKGQMVLGLYEGDAPSALMSAQVIEKDEVDAAVSMDLSNNWKGIESLSGKKVVSRIGNGFDEYVDFSMQYSENSTLSSMIKMLNSGRVDAILDWEADIMKSVNEELGGKINFVIKPSVIVSDVWYGFSPDEAGKRLKADFDKGLAILIESGKLREIMIKNLGDDGTYPY